MNAYLTRFGTAPESSIGQNAARARSTLTYQQAAELPAERDSLAAVLAGHLSAYAGTHPPASLELKEIAYLIATAPLTDKVACRGVASHGLAPRAEHLPASARPSRSWHDSPVHRLLRRPDPGEHRPRYRSHRQHR
jgi:hypothetical protein